MEMDVQKPISIHVKRNENEDEEKEEKKTYFGKCIPMQRNDA